jgi:hypothetical protein
LAFLDGLQATVEEAKAAWAAGAYLAEDDAVASRHNLTALAMVRAVGEVIQSVEERKIVGIAPGREAA